MAPADDFKSRSGSERRSDASEIQVLGKKASDLTLCYLSCPKDSAGGFLGAALITDFRTRPLEFGYVSPVRPTTMQRVLFGRTLDEHVTIDVIAKRVLQGLSRQPDIIFVDSEILLGVATLAACPVAFLARSREGESPSVRLSSLTFKVGENAADEEPVAQAIAALEPLVALYDPFERIAEALRETLKTRA